MSSFFDQVASHLPTAGEARTRRWIYVPYDRLHDAVGPLAASSPQDTILVFMESRAKGTRRPYHKKKLVLLLSAMRHFALEQARYTSLEDSFMTRILLIAFISFIGYLPTALAQSEMPYAGAPCTSTGGVKPSSQQIIIFNRFDFALRSALERNDSAALAFLVHFPLRVNTTKGQVLIPDAESLGGHYTEIFPPELRNEVLTTGAGDYICRYDEGLGYKAGAIWVSTDDHKFTLDSVNTTGAHGKSTKPALVYTCETKTHRISIEDINGGQYRYRSWNKPKELTETPDIDLSDGKLHFEGTGICSYEIYMFTKGNVEYAVGKGLGCTEGSEPKNATGILSVSIAGKNVTQTWCF